MLVHLPHSNSLDRLSKLTDFEYATVCNGTAVIRSFQKNFFYHPPQFHIFEGKKFED